MTCCDNSHSRWAACFAKGKATLKVQIAPFGFRKSLGTRSRDTGAGCSWHIVIDRPCVQTGKARTEPLCFIPKVDLAAAFGEHLKARRAATNGGELSRNWMSKRRSGMSSN